MKAGTIFVAVLFGPGARVGELFAPGEADCRWRAAATLEREAVDGAPATPAEASQITADADAGQA